MIAFLAAEDTMPGLVSARSALLDQLGLDRAHQALDVGCGLGSTVLAMAWRLPPRHEGQFASVGADGLSERLPRHDGNPVGARRKFHGPGRARAG